MEVVDWVVQIRSGGSLVLACHRLTVTEQVQSKLAKKKVDCSGSGSGISSAGKKVLRKEDEMKGEKRGREERKS